LRADWDLVNIIRTTGTSLPPFGSTEIEARRRQAMQKQMREKKRKEEQNILAGEYFWRSEDAKGSRLAS